MMIIKLSNTVNIAVHECNVFLTIVFCSLKTQCNSSALGLCVEVIRPLKQQVLICAGSLWCFIYFHKSF